MQRANLLDPMAPNPSVETLLHAFVPHKFVDHTHSTAVLGIVDQPNSRELCDELYNGRMGFVRYIMPGFGLAKESADVFDKNPKVEGLILDKHGIFTFGKDAREAYERMIEMVTHRRRAPEEEPQVRVRHRADAAARRHAGRGRADPARRGRPARSEDRRRVEAADIRFPQQRRDPQFRQRQGRQALCARRRDHARPHHPHQGLADDRAGAGRREARRFPQSGARGGGRIRRALQGIFRAQQHALQRRQGDARSGAAHVARAGPRPVRARPLEERREDRGRSRRSRGRGHHRCRSDRHLHADRRRGHVRLRILVARAGQARQRERAAARRTSRGDHRRRRRHRRCDREGIRGGRRGSGVARSR